MTGNDPALTGGYHPSSLWEGGETVTHTHTLDIPASLPIGGYICRLASMTRSRAQRLPVTGRDGTQMVDDQFELASFEAPASDLTFQWWLSLMTLRHRLSSTIPTGRRSCSSPALL